MKHNITSSLCTLALLGTIANAPAGSDNLLTLNYSGFFGAYTKLGGSFVAEGTPFSFAATFNAAAPLEYTDTGLGLFSASSLSFLIDGTAYTGSSPANQIVLLKDPEAIGHYVAQLSSADLTYYIISRFSGATTDFHAATPTATEFSDFFANDYSGAFQIALDGVTGGLVINDLSGDSAASLTVAAVPEPSQWAAISCIGVLGLAYVAKRRLTKAAH